MFALFYFVNSGQFLSAQKGKIEKTEVFNLRKVWNLEENVKKLLIVSCLAIPNNTTILKEDM